VKINERKFFPQIYCAWSVSVTLFFMSPMLSHLFTVRPTRVKMFALTVRTEVNMFTEQYILPSCHTLSINPFFRHCYKSSVNIKSLILQYNTGSNCALAQTMKNWFKLLVEPYHVWKMQSKLTNFIIYWEKYLLTFSYEILSINGMLFFTEITSKIYIITRHIIKYSAEGVSKG